MKQVVGLWNVLPKDVIVAISLEESKRRSAIQKIDLLRKKRISKKKNKIKVGGKSCTCLSSKYLPVAAIGRGYWGG